MIELIVFSATFLVSVIVYLLLEKRLPEDLTTLFVAVSAMSSILSVTLFLPPIVMTFARMLPCTKFESMGLEELYTCVSESIQRLLDIPMLIFVILYGSAITSLNILVLKYVWNCLVESFSRI
ncbi:MAG: hypothetical protein QW579_05220 [Desulfurococcaceae archaeon]